MINAEGPGQDEEDSEEFEVYEDDHDYDYGNNTFSGGDYRDYHSDIGELDDSYDYSYYGNGDD